MAISRKTQLAQIISQLFYHHALYRKSLACGLLLVGTGWLPSAIGAEAEAKQAKEPETITVIGSRATGRTEADMPVPVDLISAEQLKASGQTEVGRMLQTTVPSFNFSSSSISDGTDALRPATLRGLGPDQTLVLVNGKRRHQSALVHINTSVGRGTAGVDLNAIPGSAIGRIEVLRDGAAAQYGSDAIAGVINLVLKDESAAGSVDLSYGEYSEGDGETINFSVSKGIEWEDAFASITYEFRDRGDSNRAGLSGQCQFVCTDHPTTAGTVVATDPRESTFERQNFRIGDSNSEQHSFVVNGGMDIGDDNLYGFFTWSDRQNESGGFYRRANQDDRNPTLSDGEAYYPIGFLPLINTYNDDYSFNVGYRHAFANEITLDLSMTSGENSQEYVISNSLNASWVAAAGRGADLRGEAQTKARAGKLILELTTFNLDMTWQRDDFSYAWGAEFREDDYEVEAGETYSWADYDGIGMGASGGIQVFPGYKPENSVNESRDVVSLYLDVEWEASDDLLLTGALRYDDYDGFGDTTNAKVSGRYLITEALVLRGAVSTGFRAPSMQQLYFNNISTQFNNGIASEVGTFRNDSQLARDIGIPALEEEESNNYSFGVSYTADSGLVLTLDLYKIDIDDRIVISERLTPGLGSPALDAGLAKNGVTGAQFFINGADTETEGIDAVATYNTELGEGDLKLSMAFNITETEVTKQFSPGGLQGVDPSDVFGAQGVSIIEEWQPEDRLNLTGNYSWDDVNINLSFNRYGEYTVVDGGASQTFGAEWLTDVRINWQFSETMSVNIGANNLFDEMPDINTVGQSRAGTIVDAAGNTIVSSDGVFKYSRRSAPFGFNGAYFYAGVRYSF